MFEVKRLCYSTYFIQNEMGQYLHSDGSIYDTAEYFPSEKTAQAVLDKYYPKPEHEWKHGDVFKNDIGTWIYLQRRDGTVVTDIIRTNSSGTPEIQTNSDNVEFLFNIRERL